jgi:hypothetical protein
VIWGDTRGRTRGVAPAVRGVRAVGGVRALTAMVTVKKTDDRLVIYSDRLGDDLQAEGTGEHSVKQFLHVIMKSGGYFFL